MIDKTKIAILTTVAKFELYSKSSVYFPKGVKKYVIDGRNGMHGLHSILYMMQKMNYLDAERTRYQNKRS